MTNKNLLLIFIKNEVKGKVKTRLAETLGEDSALEIYRMLLDKTLQAANGLQNVDKIVYYGDYIAKDDRWQKDHYAKSVQYNGSLAERMSKAFEEGFRKGYESICIIGSDCWDLGADRLQEAFSVLENKDFVIGPANDGGYYLLGMNELLSSLFEGKTFSTDTVLKEAVLEIQTAGKTLARLPELIDIDTEDDLRKTALWSQLAAHQK